jgi:hypothetical protein
MPEFIVLTVIIKFCVLDNFGQIYNSGQNYIT